MVTKKDTIDLHTHTNFSDGSSTPEELVEQASLNGLKAIAITDHDQLGAFHRAKVAAKKFKLEIIPGVEVSSSLDGSTIHILGLLVDPHHKELNQYLKNLMESRIIRLHKMVKRLQGLDIEITSDEVLIEAKGATVGRPHVAKILIKKGIVQNRQEAFDRFLGSSKPAFVAYEKSEPKDAIRLIQKAGGLSFLAHPGLLRNQDYIFKLIGWGLNGLEVLHPEHERSTINRYRKLCQEKNLLMSGGSDFHGPGVPGRADLGVMKVPYDWLYQMKQSIKD